MSTALQWFKSSCSGSQGGDCVEVATQPSAVPVRDSKNIGATLTVTPRAWSVFLGVARQDPQA